MADPRSTSTTRNSTGGVGIANTPYAMDLIPFAPKFKFLYIVDIQFKAGYQQSTRTKFALLTRTATRPNPKFVTEEIPFYGVHVPVVKRTKFDPMTFTFIDDNANEMMDFFAAATKWMSPITNYQPSSLVEELQYEFAGSGASAKQYSVSSSPTPFIETIKLYHVYNYGESYNLYNFCNPVITELTLDDLDMSSSEGTTLKMVFDYTHFNLEVGKPMNSAISSIVGSTTSRLRSDL